MRAILEKRVGRTDAAFRWSSQVIGLTRVLGAILFITLLYHPLQVLGVILPPSYSAALAWDSTPDPEITGYRVYYGTSSGNYSSSIAVGNVTTRTVSGLAGGVTYFLAVAAYDATGRESAFSNEISFVPGLPTVRLVLAAGQAVLTVKGLIGHTYNIEATDDLKTWTMIGTVTLGAGGVSNFTDPNAQNFSKRFYRTRDTQP